MQPHFRALQAGGVGSKEKEGERKYAYPVTHSESGWTSQIKGELLARQYAPYRGYSLKRNCAPPGPYSWTISGAI